MRLAVLVPILALSSPLVASSQQHLGRTLQQWRDGLEAASGIERLLAARSIGEMAIAGSDGADGALLDALDHREGSVRYWAAVASVHVTDRTEKLVQTLARLLQDEVPEVRVQAALALVQSTQRDEALETIRKAIRHPNRGVRLNAVHAADAIGNAAKPLAGVLREAEGDSFDYVQRVARHALWKMGERSCPYRSCD